MRTCDFTMAKENAPARSRSDLLSESVIIRSLCAWCCRVDFHSDVSGYKENCFARYKIPFRGMLPLALQEQHLEATRLFAADLICSQPKKDWKPAIQVHTFVLSLTTRTTASRMFVLERRANAIHDGCSQRSKASCFRVSLFRDEHLSHENRNNATGTIDFGTRIRVCCVALAFHNKGFAIHTISQHAIIKLGCSTLKIHSKEYDPHLHLRWAQVFVLS